MRNIIKLLSIVVAILLLFAFCTACSSSKKVSVDELCSISGDYTDDLGNKYSYSYELPTVSGDTEYIREINAGISELYEQVKSNKESMDKGYSLFINKVWWKAAEYKGITSLIISADYDTDYVSYRIYNFDKNGNKADNLQILKAVNLSEEEFVSTLYDTLDNFLRRDDIEDEAVKSAWSSATKDTLSSENCNADIPLFISEDGTLIYCAKCIVPAGAGVYYNLFSVREPNPLSSADFLN